MQYPNVMQIYFFPFPITYHYRTFIVIDDMSPLFKDGKMRNDGNTVEEMGTNSTHQGVVSYFTTPWCSCTPNTTIQCAMIELGTILLVNRRAGIIHVCWYQYK